MHKNQIIALGVCAAAFCSLWLSKITSDPLWPIMLFSAMLLGWAIQLAVNCKCEEQTRPVVSRQA